MSGLGDAADRLYQVPPEQFVALRKELAAAARTAGDRELVKQITALRRPTRTAWQINLLAHFDPGRLNELFALGEQLADAQRRRAGDELRTLSGQRRTVIDALIRQILALGEEHGYAAPDGARQEINQTLQAALADHEVGAAVRSGRLTRSVVYGGFGGDDLVTALAASLPTPTAAVTPPGSGAVADEPPAEDPAVVAERQRLVAAAETARLAAEQAENKAEHDTTRADECAERVEALRAELRVAETEEREARDAARESRKRYAQLRTAAAHATAAADQ